MTKKDTKTTKPSPAHNAFDQIELIKRYMALGAGTTTASAPSNVKVDGSAPLDTLVKHILSELDGWKDIKTVMVELDNRTAGTMDLVAIVDENSPKKLGSGHFYSDARPPMDIPNGTLTNGIWEGKTAVMGITNGAFIGAIAAVAYIFPLLNNTKQLGLLRFYFASPKSTRSGFGADLHIGTQAEIANLYTAKAMNAFFNTWDHNDKRTGSLTLDETDAIGNMYQFKAFMTGKSAHPTVDAHLIGPHS